MKKILPFLLVILCIAGICGGYYLFSRIDRTSPVIVMTQGDKIYHSGMTASELIQGVSAVDDKSGDVSFTLNVESVSATADPAQVEVVYVARDKSNNVTRLTYLMRSDGSQVDFVPEANPVTAASSGIAGAADTGTVSQPDAQTQAAAPAENGAAQPDVAAASDGGEQPDASAAQDGGAQPDAAAAAQGQSADAGTATEDSGTGSASSDESLRAEAEAAIALLSPEAPRVYLSKYYEEVLHGTDMNLMYYVSKLEDDKDSVDDMIAKIQVLSDVNTDVPGVYHVTYYTLDSDGHQSNMATLTVRVL